MTSLRSAGQRVVARVYRWKRAHGVGDEFFARHPRLALSVMALLRPFKERSVVDVNGHRLFVDENDYLGLTIMRVYEPDVTAFLHRIVKPGDRLVDVGANIGYFTVLMAKLAGPHGKVMAFEPEPSNFDLLTTNVRCNGYANVELRRAAVSDLAGETTLFLSEENPGDHRLGVDTDRSRLIVPACTLDVELAGSWRPLRLVKIDTQGSEFAVLRGAARLLSESQHLTIVLEYSPSDLERAREEPVAMLRFLAGHGLQPFQLAPGGRTALSTFERLEEMARSGVMVYENVVFTRPATAGSWA